MSARRARASPEREIVRLAAAMQRAERMRSEGGPELWRSEPAVSAWSPAQHLFHLALANELSLKNALCLAADQGLLVRPCGATPTETLAVLGRARIPRGRARSPRFVTPPQRVELELLVELQRDNLVLLSALDPEALVRAPRCVPHQLLGDLTAPLWVRFALVHALHHLRIAGEILRAARAPRPLA